MKFWRIVGVGCVPGVGVGVGAGGVDYGATVIDTAVPIIGARN
jgi:hypothetical protein